MSTDLAHRATVAEIVRAYQQASEKTRTAFALLAEAESGLSAAAAGQRCVSIQPIRGNGIHWSKDADRVLDQTKRQVWSNIVDRLQIKKTLSIARAKELDDALDTGELPEITEDAIRGFLGKFAASLDASLSEAAVEVFDWLRPRYGSRAAKLKTNEREVLGAKVIVPGILEKKFCERGYRIKFHYRQNVQALEAVMRSLDGKGPALGWQSELETAIDATPECEGVTTYFRWKAHANLGLHITFLRPDLVSELNRRVGGKNLRTAA